ncbi:hypothetical protein [Streptomyces bicolor]|uniref:hypothetical protein n=1 Tax=Streptomyces bicolor TaxID=66874 RepID=UPI0004E1931E|nr:hypothetical protein [Streptomyces bicolor]
MKIVSSTLKRAVGPALAAGLVVTAAASPAAAQTPGSTAFRLFGSVYLSARGGVANQVTATVTTAGRLILTDTTGIAAGSGCSPTSSPTTVDCGVVTTSTRLSVGLGDGNDTYNGGSIGLRTLVDAGPGFDSVTTGGGNDTIGVSDGVLAEPVNCGGGTDVVFRDVGDNINANCEVRY